VFVMKNECGVCQGGGWGEKGCPNPSPHGPIPWVASTFCGNPWWVAVVFRGVGGGRAGCGGWWVSGAIWGWTAVVEVQEGRGGWLCVRGGVGVQWMRLSGGGGLGAGVGDEAMGCCSIQGRARGFVGVVVASGRGLL